AERWIRNTITLPKPRNSRIVRSSKRVDQTVSATHPLPLRPDLPPRRSELARWTDRSASLSMGDEKEEFVLTLGNIIGIWSESFIHRLPRMFPELYPDR